MTDLELTDGSPEIQLKINVEQKAHDEKAENDDQAIETENDDQAFEAFQENTRKKLENMRSLQDEMHAFMREFKIHETQGVDLEKDEHSVDRFFKKFRKMADVVDKKRKEHKNKERDLSQNLLRIGSQINALKIQDGDLSRVSRLCARAVEELEDFSSKRGQINFQSNNKKTKNGFMLVSWAPGNYPLSLFMILARCCVLHNCCRRHR
jgi:hypothetical protein